MPATPVVPSTSPLDGDHVEFDDLPYFDLTLALLRCVRDADFDLLSTLCDDDFGIVDIDPAGTAVPIRNRTEWEAWFRTLFAQLDTLGATTDSEVLAYDAVTAEDLGYSVLEFRQSLTIDGWTATFDCIATIVWKLTPTGWREARWHGSVVDRHVPLELVALAG